MPYKRDWRILPYRNYGIEKPGFRYHNICTRPIPRGLFCTHPKAGLLTLSSSSRFAFPNLSGSVAASYTETQLPYYSDEFVQDFHLLPFSPGPALWAARHLRTSLFTYVCMPFIGQIHVTVQVYHIEIKIANISFYT